MTSASDSARQRALEPLILARAEGLPAGRLVEHHQVQLGAGSFVDIDGAIVDDDGTLLAVMEVFTTLGPLKAGQKNKLKGDILKLAAFVEPPAAKVIVTTSPTAHAWLTGQSWCAEAARRLGITIAPVVPLTAEERAELEATRASQRRGMAAGESADADG